jgi:hypothetical protein
MCLTRGNHITPFSTFSPIAKMSETSRNLAIARIPGSRSWVNDRAPVELGHKRGYFKDLVMRVLLGLNKGDFLRADGTYGEKELASGPVDFSLL